MSNQKPEKAWIEGMRSRLVAAGLLSLLAVVLLMAVAVLQNRQDRLMNQATKLAADARAARTDLASGFVHVMEAHGSDGAFDDQTGRALMAQGIASLRRVLASTRGEVVLPELEPGMLEKLDSDVTLLEQALAESQRTPGQDSRGDVLLRSRFAAVDSLARTADSALLRELSVVQREHQNILRATTLVAGFVILLAMVGLLTMVRGEQLAATRLRESRQRFELLFDLSPLPMAFSTADGRIVRTNAEYPRCFGYRVPGDFDTVAEWFARAYPDPDYQQHARSRWAEALQLAQLSGNGIVPAEEYRVRCADGRARMVAIAARLLPDGVITAFHDVTERRAAEEMLRAQEERYRTLFVANPEPMWVFDQETLRFLDVNDAAIREYGYSREEFLALTIKDIRPPEDVPALMEKVIAPPRGLDDAGIWRHQAKDGTVRSVRIITHPLIFSGRPAEIVIAHDLTELVRQQTELQRSKARFEAVFSGTINGILLLDPRGCIVEGNPAACALIGSQREQILGLPIGEVMEGVVSELERAPRQGRISIRRRDRCKVVADFNVVEEVLPGLAMIVFSDVTSQGEAEEGLRRLSSELEERVERRTQEVRRQAAALAACTQGVAMVLDGLIDHANPAFLKLFDVDPAAAAGLDWRGLFPESERQAMTRQFESTGDDGPWAAEVPALRHDGTRFDASVQIVRVPDKGHLLLVEDVTQRNLHRDEILSAGRMKDEFLANMSHELRTPLNGILGLGEALQEGIYGPVSERQLRTLERIEQSGRHLLDLINDILDLAKVDAGKMQLVVAPVHVRPLVQDLQAVIESLARGKSITLHWEMATGLPAIRGDARRVRQVLLNVLGNAVKFVSQPGDVWFEAKPAAEGSMVELMVRDSGPGMAPEQIPMLFKPFTQLDNGLSRGHGGSGLGLAISKRLVELQGGSIAVTSEVGEGSSFTILLPTFAEAVAPESQCRASATQLPPRISEARRILVADDNETNIVALTDFLGALGYECLLARDGVEALEMATERKPDIILMDIQMPRMDGLQATRRLRADERTRSTPIIAVTSYAMTGDRAKCIAAGCDEHLSKPISLRGLEATIERLLRSKREEGRTGP